MIQLQRNNAWSDTTANQRWLVVLLCALATLSTGRTDVYAGTIRYDLPQLLGEYRHDDETDNSASATVVTPFLATEVSRATFVIVGSVAAGRARGDGVVYQATEFELAPSVHVTSILSFSLAITSSAPQPGAFRMSETFTNPLYMESVSQTGIRIAFPFNSISLAVRVDRSLSAVYPNPVDPATRGIVFLNGFIVEMPVIANLTEAYVILEGSSIIPEPGSGVMILLGASSLILSPRRLVRA